MAARQATGSTVSSNMALLLFPSPAEGSAVWAALKVDQIEPGQDETRHQPRGFRASRSVLAANTDLGCGVERIKGMRSTREEV